MEKREKIMLGVMAATLAVAALMFYYDPAKAPAGAGPAAVAVNMDEVNKAMAEAKLTPELAYRVSLMTQPVAGNPFFGETSALSQSEDRSAGAQSASGEPVYSGYMKVGQRLYAVIDGVEYARGDQLAEGGYVIQNIDKDSVLLERTDGSTGRKFTKRLPLVEDDTDKIRIRVVKKR